MFLLLKDADPNLSMENASTLRQFFVPHVVASWVFPSVNYLRTIFVTDYEFHVYPFFRDALI